MNGAELPCRMVNRKNKPRPPPIPKEELILSLYTLLTSYPFHYANLCSFSTSASATCNTDSFCSHTQADLVSEAHLSFLFLTARKTVFYDTESKTVL